MGGRLIGVRLYITPNSQEQPTKVLYDHQLGELDFRSWE